MLFYMVRSVNLLLTSCPIWLITIVIIEQRHIYRTGRTLDSRNHIVRYAVPSVRQVGPLQISYTPKQTDVTQPDKISKLRKYKETQNKKFNSMGTAVYRRLRKDFYKACNAQGVLGDLLFNYQSQGGVGLTIKDRHGQHDFKVTKGNSKKPVARTSGESFWALH